MSYSQVFVLVLFEMFVLFGIVYRISMDLKNNFLAKCIMGVLVSSILLTTSNYFQSNGAISTSINIVIAFTVIKFITGYKLDKIIVLYTFSLSAMYFLQLLSMIVLKVLMPEFNMTFKYGLYAAVLTFLLLFIVFKFLPIKRIFNEIIEGNRWVRIAVINAFVVYYLIVMLWYNNFTGFLESIIAVLMIMSVLFGVNVLLVKELFEKQIIKQRMELFDTYLPIVEEMIEEIRNKQHDYHNHLQALEGINMFDDYRDELMEDNPWNKLLHMDNKLLMAFLFSKYNLAHKQDVHINFKIKNNLVKTSYTDFELIELLGILMDNALEAVLRTGYDAFDLLIDYVDGKTIVEIANESPFIDSKDIRNMFERKISSKGTDDHGIGLPKLEKILKKNNDTIVVHYDITKGKIVFRVELS